jgi:UDP-N-acetylmuramate--alanine ligase
MKKIYCIGIGGIGVSALARYYLSQGYSVFWSDKSDSALINALKKERIDIIIGQDATRIDTSFEKVIYSEAVPLHQEELQKAQSLGVKTLKYNLALAEIANPHKLIAISGTHGKSTTTSLISLILKDSGENFYSVIGTLLKEFGGKNFSKYYDKKYGDISYFALEACEYKEHFLAYSPLVLVITNIEYDHADYFKTPESYIKAFEKMIDKVVPGGYVIYNQNDKNSQNIIGKRSDISYIWVSQKEYIYHGEKYLFPKIKMQLPGDHILFDAKLAYVVAHMIGISDEIIVQTLAKYTWVWRRMEIIWNTENGNMLMSDYGHHPTEISVTLKALKEGFPDKKVLMIFQPHQYSRTLELLEGFQNCFSDADSVIIPNIYASRDSQEDMQKISAQSLVASIHHDDKIFGDGLKNTLSLIEKYDREYPNSSIILLQGAGDIDTLRYEIKTR